MKKKVAEEETTMRPIQICLPPKKITKHIMNNLELIAVVETVPQVLDREDQEIPA